MKYADIHVHHKHTGTTASSILKTMDEVGLEKICLISWYGKNLEQQKKNLEEVAAIMSECPQRIYGLAWIEPRHKTPLELLEWAVCEKKYRGFKMIPNKWSPDEEWLFPYYEKMAELGVPCLFHSGILYFEHLSSRYCRHVNYEELIRVSNFTFALAHISWPWTDECLALFGQARALKTRVGYTSEMFIDITPGTPPDYRIDAFRRLISFGAEDNMILGTDLGSDNLSAFKKQIENELRIFEKLELSQNVIKKICYDNFHKFFGENSDD